MSPDQLRAIREARGESQSEFGLALGFGGTKADRGNMICKFERGKKPLPATLQFRVWCLGKHDGSDLFEK